MVSCGLTETHKVIEIEMFITRVLEEVYGMTWGAT